MQSTIQFCGGAGAVTGSNFFLSSGGLQLLVDCGLSQGMHSAEENNWAPFPYNPSAIQFLIITHAHIDHIGLVPRLVKEGFRGRIFSTEATKALSQPLLLDSMELLAHDARKHGKEELYDEKDIGDAMMHWEGIPYHKTIELADGFSFEFLNAGHILGSGMAHIMRGSKSMVFTGDLGGGNSPLLSGADDLPKIEYLVMESVYGDRVRPKEDTRVRDLENIIEETAQRGGTLLIPAFSTERTQDILFDIRRLMTEKKVPSMPVYADSPLASKITAAYLQYPQYFSEEIRKRVEGGENIFIFPELHFVENAVESKKLAAAANPKIIVASSGMSTGGRVHEHEQWVLPDEKSTLLIVGYQAAGSLGRRLVEGEKRVRIEGEDITVKCKVESLYGYSAHMDSEQLLEFVNKEGGETLKEIFVVMGEPSSSSFLAQRIRDYLSIKAITPEAGEKVEIEL